MRKLALFFGMVLLVSGQDKRAELDESFDPNTLNEPEIDLPIMLHPGDTLPAEIVPAPADTMDEGYRVQVLSTQDNAAAYGLLAELLPLFENQVYVIFDSPNYKVRVGNFRSRYDAEEAQARLAGMGYGTAWIIRTRIKTGPRAQKQ